MEKQHVNPFIVRQKAESKQGKEFAKELEDLNWQLQEHQFKGYKLQLAYDIKAEDYKKFLGYEIDEDQHNKKIEELKQYDSTVQ